MLSGVLNIPHSNFDWSKWSWDHKLSHDRIRAAIKKKLGYDLTDYQIDPIEPSAFRDFLQDNSALHNDMNAALHLPGINLLDADLSNPNQKALWINSNYLEHFYAEAALGIGS